jgi:hypothetical protein
MLIRQNPDGSYSSAMAPDKKFAYTEPTYSNPFSKAVSNITAPIVNPVEKAVSQVSSNLVNLPGSVENTVKQVAANPITQVALAVYMPTIASYLGPYLTAIPAAYQTAVAGALASTALQTAQGVPFDFCFCKMILLVKVNNVILFEIKLFSMTIQRPKSIMLLFKMKKCLEH